MKNNFETKEDCTTEDFKKMSPFILKIIIFTNLWCMERDITPYWTSFISDRKEHHNKPPHSDGRAADLSLLAVFGWTADLVNDYQHDINKEFKNIGAIVLDKDTGEYYNKPIYIHGKGKAVHAHLQIKKGLTALN